MSRSTDFKNALQALTTTLVKAEAARDTDAAAFAALRLAHVAQWQRVVATHAALVAEQEAAGDESSLPHESWYEQTAARTVALFGTPVAS